MSLNQTKTGSPIIQSGSVISTDSASNNEKLLNIADFMRILRERRKAMAFIFIFCMLITGYFSVRSYKQVVYQSSATFLPSENDFSGSAAGELSGFAGLLGLNRAGSKDVFQKINSILAGRSIHEKVIETQNLLPEIYGELYDQETRTLKNQENKGILGVVKKTIKEILRPPKLDDEGIPLKTINYNQYRYILSNSATVLKAAIEVVSVKGLMVLNVKWNNPELAAKIANLYTSELEKFFQQKTISSVRKKIVFIEDQLKKTEEQLKHTEQKYQAFIEKYGFEIKEQSVIVIGAIAGIRKQIEEEEVNFKVTSDFEGEDSTQASISKARLEALLSQLQKLEQGGRKNSKNLKSLALVLNDIPALAVENGHLKQELAIQQEIYKMLRTQLEASKIEESKKLDTMHIIDYAIPPRFPMPSRVGTIIGMGLFSSLFMVVFLALVLAARENLESAEKKEI
jgi:uncharacterized protein involved in exopolysaccharide biosynthesis